MRRRSAGTRADGARKPRALCRESLQHGALFNHPASPLTPSPPTRRRQTAPSPGTAPPSSSSRSPPGGKSGIGYSYADKTTAQLAHTLLREVIDGSDVHAHAALWLRMRQHVRNLGDRGIAAMAISAIDNCLWDLRAKLHGVAAGAVAGRCARIGTGVWQRRVHHLFRRADRAAARRLGAGRAQVREDEGRHRSRSAILIACRSRAAPSARRPRCLWTQTERIR